MYTHIKYPGQAPAPIELIIWALIDETGWTLDYVRGMSMMDFYEWINIKAGKAKARNG